MTSHQPVSPFDSAVSIEIDVDLIAVDRFSLLVRNRADGSTHALAYDCQKNLWQIGPNARGDAYTLIMPRVLAQMQGFCE